MKKCILCGEKFIKGTSISFHGFPKDIDLRIQWLKLCGLDEWDITEHSLLCSKHFPKESIDVHNRLTFLKRGAIPSIGVKQVKEERLQSLAEIPKMAQNLTYVVLERAPSQVYCRICLTTDITIKYKMITSPYESNQILAQVIADFAQIKVLERTQLSTLVCLNCIDRLTASIQFRSLIRETDLKLRQRFYKTTSTSKNIEPKSSYFNQPCHILQEDIKIEEIELVDETITGAPPPSPPLVINNNNYNDNNRNTTIDNTFDVRVKEVGKRPKKYQRYAVQCRECPLVLRSYSSIKQHSKIHQSLNRYRCSFCNKGFWIKGEWMDHEAIHKDSTPNQCHICGKGFKNAPSLRIHKRVHLNTTFQCEHCGKCFKWENSLKQHTFLHMDECRYKCNWCDERFKNAFKRTEHVHRVHKARPLYTCDICGKSVRSLTTHIKFHTKPYKCEICNRSFGSTKLLATHKISHSDERRFLCILCKKTFKHPVSLAIHQRVHESERRFKCEWCEKKFNYKHLLKLHAKKQHTNEDKGKTD